MRATALFLAAFCIAFFAYKDSKRKLPLTDAAGVVWTTYSLLYHGTTDLRQIPGLSFDATSHWALKERNGRLLSAFPPWIGAHVAPVMLVTEVTIDPENSIAGFQSLNRRAAALWMALAAAVMALLLAREFAWPVALLAWGGYALGSVNAFVLGQTIYSNGIVQFWTALALLAVFRKDFGAWAATGALMAQAFAAVNRPPQLALLVVLAGWVVWRLRARAIGPLVACGGLVGALAAIGYWDFGAPFYVYSLTSDYIEKTAVSFWQGLYANTIGPSRGAFLFSPWQLFALIGPLAARRWPERLLLLGMVGCIVAMILAAANHPNWFGGGSFGPRLTAGFLPLAAILMAAAMQRLGGWESPEDALIESASPRAALSKWSRRVVVGSAVGIFVAFSVCIAHAHANDRKPLWYSTPTILDNAPSRVNDWRDPLIFYPFSDPATYEARYPIRLLTPADNATVHGEEMTFTWTALPNTDTYTIEIEPISPKHIYESYDRGPFREPRWTFPPIPQDAWEEYREWESVAWRVIARNERWEVIATSHWRVFHFGEWRGGGQLHQENQAEISQ